MSVGVMKLGDIANLSTGKLDSNAATEGGAYPFFTCDPTTLAIDNYAFDTEAVLLAGNNASGNFTAKYFKGKFNAYQRTYVITTKDRDVLLTSYLHYALNMSLLSLKSQSAGSTTKYLTKTILNSLPIPVPSIDSQQRIVEILSSFDNLIENNRKQIALLEEAAQRLYKEWFVDLRFPGHDYAELNSGVPSGWKRLKLGEYAPFKRGKVITAKQAKPGSIPVVAGGLEPAYYHAEANTSGPVVTVSGSGANAGFTRLYLCDVWASDCSYADVDTNENVLFVYLSVKLLGQGFRHLQRGSAQPHVYPTHINDLDLLVPPREVLDQFNCIVAKQYEAMRTAEQSIEAAREARDRLLPKLMSGEIEVEG